MNGPGTVPLYVQYSYVVPGASSATTCRASRLRTTFVFSLRVMEAGILSAFLLMSSVPTDCAGGGGVVFLFLLILLIIPQPTITSTMIPIIIDLLFILVFQRTAVNNYVDPVKHSQSFPRSALSKISIFCSERRCLPIFCLSHAIPLSISFVVIPLPLVPSLSKSAWNTSSASVISCG